MVHDPSHSKRPSQAVPREHRLHGRCREAALVVHPAIHQVSLAAVHAGSHSCINFYSQSIREVRAACLQAYLRIASLADTSGVLL